MKVTDVLCIVLILFFCVLAYSKLFNVPLKTIFNREHFAYESNPASSSCNPMGPYKCMQNDYRPEVLTTFGTYATQECQQSLCKD